MEKSCWLGYPVLCSLCNIAILNFHLFPILVSGTGFDSDFTISCPLLTFKSLSRHENRWQDKTLGILYCISSKKYAKIRNSVYAILIASDQTVINKIRTEQPTICFVPLQKLRARLRQKN